MNKKFQFLKKDLILLLILGMTIILVDYALTWNRVYKENKVNTSIISDYIPEISLLEFENYVEENPEGFIYFGIIDDEKSRNFELDFKDIIVDNYLKETIIHINLKNEDFDDFKNKYSNISSELEVPVIVYYTSGKAEDYISYSNSNFDEETIINFIAKYEEIAE